MKVTGPGSGSPTDATGGVAETEKSGGKAFADKLEKSGEASPAGETSASPEARNVQSIAADIGAKLQAHEIDARTAVDQVIGRILDKQIGVDAPPGVRSKVEAALREALESDPLLVERMKSLSRD